MQKVKLTEFIGLLKIGSKKQINEWKDNHHFLDWESVRCRDVDVIFHLHKDYNTGVIDKDIMNYVKYIYPDAVLETEVKWISNKKKMEYLTNYCFW